MHILELQRLNTVPSLQYKNHSDSLWMSLICSFSVVMSEILAQKFYSPLIATSQFGFIQSLGIQSYCPSLVPHSDSSQHPIVSAFLLQKRQAVEQRGSQGPCFCGFGFWPFSLTTGFQLYKLWKMVCVVGNAFCLLFPSLTIIQVSNIQFFFIDVHSTAGSSESGQLALASHLLYCGMAVKALQIFCRWWTPWLYHPSSQHLQLALCLLQQGYFIQPQRLNIYALSQDLVCYSPGSLFVNCPDCWF